MAPKRDKKPAPVANRDDAFGPAARTRSACSASSVASSLQDLSLSSDRVQLPTPTAQAHDSTLIDSAMTGVLSLPKSTAGSRHGFRMAISYRKVTAKDEVGDRRRRQRDGLMSKTADTSSSIYRARYESLPVDTALDDAYLPPGEGEEEDGTGGLEANEEVASKTQEPLAIPETGLGASGTPRRTNETSLNARAARNKEIEEELLKASEDRLNPDMLDIEPSDDMSESERALWDRLVGDLVKEMETPSTPLGKLVKKIHGNHSSDRRGEDELAKQFADFCNYVAQRLAYAVLGQYAHGVSGLFRFSGNRFMKDGHVPHPGSGKAASDNKLDIIVNGENTEDDDDVRWDHALTFGEVKLRLSSDLKDVLIGQMLRYLVSARSCFLSDMLCLRSLRNFLHCRSEKSCKTIQSPAGTSASRCAAICYAFSKPTPSNSVPRLRTVSKNRKTTERSSVRSLYCPVQLSSCQNSGNHLLKTPSLYEKPTTDVSNIAWWTSKGSLSRL